ncbi:MAG: hypothetical protein U1F68_18465 [Gammaproteobacteria bacterium]
MFAQWDVDNFALNAGLAPLGFVLCSAAMLSAPVTAHLELGGHDVGRLPYHWRWRIICARSLRCSTAQPV